MKWWIFFSELNLKRVKQEFVESSKEKQVIKDKGDSNELLEGQIGNKFNSHRQKY